jgi:hypothetical protein
MNVEGSFTMDDSTPKVKILNIMTGDILNINGQKYSVHDMDGNYLEKVDVVLKHVDNHNETMIVTYERVD